jgi:hypothetical protein
MLKKLPIGIQTFSEIIEEDYVYVDKTKYLYDLIRLGKVYFLSRPRRFGKSLIVSTLEELFSGRKDVFKGFYIYDKWDWDEKYPVILIDFSLISNESPEVLKSSLSIFLDRVAKRYSISLISQGSVDKLSELIEELHNLFNQRVVVLIDEYDKAIIDNLDDLELADANRKVLKNFYGVLKGSNKYLKFVFITGVSKFSNTSIFSGLNNLEDITLDEKYANICGYTHKELEYFFKEHIIELGKKESLNYSETLDKINYWYDGYSWDGKDNLYNPQSTLLLFKKREFNNYWFKTGTPTFMIQLLKKENNLQPIIEPITVKDFGIEDFDIEAMDSTSLLFQSGYLTIKEKKYDSDSVDYILDIPNFEVKYSLINYLMMAFTNLKGRQLLLLSKEINAHILNRNSKGLTKSLKEIFNQIPYTIKGNKESFYHSIFLVILYLFGIKSQGEVITYTGRIDILLKINKQIIITEIKYSTKKTIETMLQEGFNQIKDKEYYNKYIRDNPIYLSIAFTKTEIACQFKEKL